MSEEQYLAEIDKAEDAILAEMRVAEVVTRDCSRRHLERGLPAECGWPECGCDPQVFARDILSAQPRL